MEGGKEEKKKKNGKKEEEKKKKRCMERPRMMEPDSRTPPRQEMRQKSR